MRLTKKFKIDDTEIEVRELTVAEVLNLLETVQGSASMTDVASAVLEQASNLDVDQIVKMAPSEIKRVLDAFLEVNGDFLALADRLKIRPVLNEMAKAVLTEMERQVGQALRSTLSGPAAV